MTSLADFVLELAFKKNPGRKSPDLPLMLKGDVLKTLYPS